MSDRFTPPPGDFFSAEALIQLDRDLRARHLQFFLDEGWKFHPECDGYCSPKKLEEIDLLTRGGIPI